MFYCAFKVKTDGQKCEISGAGKLSPPDVYEEFESLEHLLKSFDNSQHTLYLYDLNRWGESIVAYLIQNGYQFIKAGKVQAKRYNAIIDEYGNYYMIKFCVGHRRFVIYDIQKIIPLKLDAINKAFECNQDINTLKGNCTACYLAHKDFLDIGLDKITISSNALQDCKQRININFNNFYPPLRSDHYAEIAKYYRGGICLLNPAYKNKILYNVEVYDVNGLYSYVLKNKPMPYGNPIPFNGKYKGDKNGIYLQHIKTVFKLRDGYMPTVQIKGSSKYPENVYLKHSSGEILDLYLTNLDLKIFMRNYHVIFIEYIDGYSFKSSVGTFGAYVDYWQYQKENNTGGKRQIAKLMGNSLTGKFALNPVRKNRIPIISNGIVTMGEEYEQEAQQVYAPLSIFITAWGRSILMEKINIYNKYNRFVYSDTDSLHIVKGLLKGMWVDQNKLGAWKLEHKFDVAKYLHQKCYYGEEGGQKIYAVAGLPKSEDVEREFTIDTFAEGKEVNTYKAASIEGGKIQKETKFKLSGGTKNVIGMD